jgi:hypothetical protein
VTRRGRRESGPAAWRRPAVGRKRYAVSRFPRRCRRLSSADDVGTASSPDQTGQGRFPAERHTYPRRIPPVLVFGRGARVRGRRPAHCPRVRETEPDLRTAEPLQHNILSGTVAHPGERLPSNAACHISASGRQGFVTQPPTESLLADRIERWTIG